MSDYPAIGKPIIIFDKSLDSGMKYSSRVEGYDGDVIIAALPNETQVEDDCHIDDRMMVTWTNQFGLNLLPVKLTKIEANDNLRFWYLSPNGEATLKQRRNFVRVRTYSPLKLFVESKTLEGTVVNLSEVSLKGVFDENINEIVSEDSEVSFSFVLNNSIYSSDSRVVRVEEKALAIVFELDKIQRKELIKEIFEIQRLELRKMRESR